MPDSSQRKLYNKDSVSEFNCSHQRSSLLYGPDSRYTKYSFVTIMLHVNQTQNNIQYGGGRKGVCVWEVRGGGGRGAQVH